MCSVLSWKDHRQTLRNSLPMQLCSYWWAVHIVCVILHVPYSGKFLQLQTFAKMSPESPEEIFAVLIFATKPCIVRYQLGC